MLNVSSNLDFKEISRDASLNTPPDNIKPFPLHWILSLAQKSLQGSDLNKHCLNAGMGRNRDTEVWRFRKDRSTETLDQGSIDSSDQSIVSYRVQSFRDIAACEADLASLYGSGNPLVFRQDELHVHFESVGIDHLPCS